jgi:Ni2+-binding GTPase involved in maturation of urease and hydrogenase
MKHCTGVKTDGRLHTAFHRDASVNISAVKAMLHRHPGLEPIFIEKRPASA